jgi:hypothetical protein
MTGRTAAKAIVHTGSVQLGAFVVPGSILHAVGVAVYQRHVGDQTGLCVSCRTTWPCPPRLHASVVIEAAGDDPHRHDPAVQAAVEPSNVSNDAAAEAVSVPEVLSPTAVGYAIGGKNRSRVSVGTWER